MLRIVFVVALSRNDFLQYRRSHDAPRSRSAFEVWRGNGGMDEGNFTWRPIFFKGLLSLFSN